MINAEHGASPFTVYTPRVIATVIPTPALAHFLVEGHCGICQGSLEAGRCNACWVDWIVNMDFVEDGIKWHIECRERCGWNGVEHEVA